MRKIFENGISLLVALGSLGLCIRWYWNTGEIEPLIGIIASAGALLTTVVYRIFPEKKESPAVYSEGVTSSHPLTMAHHRADHEKLGDYYNRIENLELALTYYEVHNQLGKELYEAHPTYAEFTKNFNWAKEALEET